MSFLSPWAALFAAAVAVPLLLLLYKLKLRRQTLRMSSTLLWQAAFEDLQANAPFQRLRASLLLFLQLLILGLLLFALAGPMLEGVGEAGGRIILLVDRSASMNAVLPGAPRAAGDDAEGEGEPRTRLDQAKAEAHALIDRLDNAAQRAAVMVIAFGRSPIVVSGFESNARTLHEAIERISPSDERTNLEAALQLAGAFAGQTSESESTASGSPEVVVISDGGFEPPRDGRSYRLRAGGTRFIQVGDPPGAPVENLGVAALSASRDIEEPGLVRVFTRIVNSSAEARSALVQLEVDTLEGRPVQHAESITVPPADDAGPGEQAVSFRVELPGGGLLRVRHTVRDMLTADDAAAVVLPAPRRPRLALVHEGEAPTRFLLELLRTFEPAEIDALSLESYRAIDPMVIDRGERYDLIVFDAVTPMRLPGVPSLTVGGTPAPLGALPAEPGEEDLVRPILSWDRQHPVMRHVELDRIVFADFTGFDLPVGAEALALGPDGPVIATLRLRNAPHIVVGFGLELDQSTWALHVSAPVFMLNAIEYLTLAQSGQEGIVHQPGETIRTEALPEAQRVVVEGPVSRTLEVEPGAPVTLPRLSRAGVYAVEGTTLPLDTVAVSVLNERESDLRTRDRVRINAEAVPAGEVSAEAARPIWPWLLLAALVMLLVEWLVYLGRHARRPRLDLPRPWRRG